MLPNGTIIDNRYEIISVLGAGAFGAVYRAVQKQLDRPVAIKTLNTTLLQEADGLARFEREAVAINALKHKNIVGFYGYGVWQQAPYMVMELIEGTSLFHGLSTETKLEPKRAAIVIKQVFEALACAHASGVVHRDLKPTNIMLQPDPNNGMECVKIIDFGLAKLLPGYGVPGQKLTETGYALGTCHYMAPEQALGGQVDQRADIYAAGCILYQMLAGKLPFDADNNVAIMYQHINDQPGSLLDVLGEHPMGAALTTFVANCIAKDPADRYQSCTEALADLNAILFGTFRAVKQLSVPSKKRKAIQVDSRAAVIVVAIGAVFLAASFIFCSTLKTGERAPGRFSSTDLYLRSGAADAMYLTAPKSDAAVLLSVLQQDEKDHLLSHMQRLRVFQLLADAAYIPDSEISIGTLKRAELQSVVREKITLVLQQRKREGHLELPSSTQDLFLALHRCNMIKEADELAEQLFARGLPYVTQASEVAPLRHIHEQVLIDYIQQDRFEDAEPHAKAVLIMSGQTYMRTAANCFLADLACIKGKFRLADKYYDDAISNAIRTEEQMGTPFATRAVSGKARVAIKLGNYDAAHKYATQVREAQHQAKAPSIGATDMIDIAAIAKLTGCERADQAAQEFGSSLQTIYSRRLAEIDTNILAETLREKGCHNCAKTMAGWMSTQEKLHKQFGSQRINSFNAAANR